MGLGGAAVPALPALLATTVRSRPAPAPVPEAFASMCPLGVGLGLAQPLILSRVSDLSAPDVRGAAIGLRPAADRPGQTVVPPAIGVVVADGGSTGVFPGCAVVLAAATGTCSDGA